MLLRRLSQNIWGAAWVKAWPIRGLSYTIDTLLLTAALMLIKVMLVPLYIMLGYFALRGASARRRWASFGAAVVTYGFVITIARARNPLGIFA